MAIGTLSNGGDLGAGLRSVLTRGGLESIAIAMTTAGLMEGIEYVLPSSLKGAQSLATQRSIEQHLASGLGKSLAGGLVGTAFGRKLDIEDILGTSFVEGLGALGANMICDWYGANPNDYWTHKASHFGLGALMGASLNSRDPAAAALAGGVGGVVGEMAAEMLFGGPKELATNPINPDSVRTELFVSKMVGGIAGTLVSQGGHPHIAFLTAHNAVENNYLRMIVSANGTIETRIIDDESRPKDAVYLVTEDSKTAQTKSLWYVPGEETPLEGGTVRQWTGHAAEGLRSAGKTATSIMERYPTATTAVGYGLSALELGTEGYALLAACGGPQAATPVCWGTAGFIALRHSGAFGWGGRQIGQGVEAGLNFLNADPNDSKVIGDVAGFASAFILDRRAGKFSPNSSGKHGRTISGRSDVTLGSVKDLHLTYRDQGPYNPYSMYSLLASKYGFYNVQSHTLPLAGELFAGGGAKRILDPRFLLPAPKHHPYQGGFIRSFATKEPETYLRVSSTEYGTGGFVMKESSLNHLKNFLKVEDLEKIDPIRLRSFLGEGLALHPSNKALYLQFLEVPAGVRLQRSRAKPVLPFQRQRGGLEQFELLGTKMETSWFTKEPLELFIR